ncbi:hypothetical protein RUM43_014987 [Polyplax serrata]|uniref:Uncharacterized protein n=1 Tax=Polyplax serrata TaxID=468196 RepID=A0AAN8NHX3_POLSC
MNFSSGDMTNLAGLAKLKFGKKEVNENRERGKFELENSEELDNSKQIGKESIWRKWLTFLREHWVLRKNRSPKAHNMVALSLPQGSTETSIDFNSSQKTEPEIVSEPEQKISRILLNSKTNRIQATTDEYNNKCRNPTVNDEELMQNFSTVAPIDEDYNKSEGKNFENHMIAAVYISTNMEEMIESKNSVFATASEEDTHSRHSINLHGLRRIVNTKKFEERHNNETTPSNRNTFKTLSEPSWNEKHKIFQRQKLQENLNDLMEQFLFLESDDLDSNKSSNSQNKLIPEKSQSTRNSYSFTIPLSTYSGNEFLVKKVSREVAPEILVNIKPFKEYTSRRCTNAQSSNISEIIFNQGKKKKEFNEYKSKQEETYSKCRYRITKNSKKKENTSRCGLDKISKTRIYVLNRENATSADKPRRLRKGSDRQTKVKMVTHEVKPILSNYIWSSNLRDRFRSDDSYSEYIFDTPDMIQKRPLCSVLGIYKSYVDFERMVQHMNGIKRESFEEILSDLDDKDHGILFKKNLGQFKKQISIKVEPVELSRSSAVSITNLQPPNSTNFNEISIKNSEIKSTENEVETDAREKKRMQFLTDKTFSSQIEPSSNESKWCCLMRLSFANICSHGKLFENFYLVLPQGNLTSGMAASRVVTSFIESKGSCKEVLRVAESHFRMLIKRMLPESRPLKIEEKRKTLSAEIEQFGRRSLSINDIVDLDRETLQDVLSETKTVISSYMEEKNEDQNGRQSDGKFINLYINPVDFYLAGNDRCWCDSELSLPTSLDEPETDPEKDLGYYRSKVIAEPMKLTHQVVQILNSPSSYFVVVLRDPSASPSSSALSKRICQTEIMRKPETTKFLFFKSATGVRFTCKKKEVCEYQANVSLNHKFNAKDNLSMVQEETDICTNNLLDKQDNQILEKMIHINRKKIQWFLDLGKNGTEILYDGFIKKYLNEYEESQSSSATLHSKTFRFKYRVTSDFFKTAEIPRTIVLTSNATNLTDKVIFPRILFANHDSSSRVIKYESTSSQGNEVSTYHPLTENHLKTFLHNTSGIDKTDYLKYQNSRKKIIVVENGIVIRQTGSAILRKCKTFVGSIYMGCGIGSESNPRDLRTTHLRTSLTLPEDEEISRERTKSSWQLLTEKSPDRESREYRCTQSKENVRTFRLERSRKPGTREIMTTIGSIRDFDHQTLEDGEKGTKRMSLIILLSKNK